MAKHHGTRFVQLVDAVRSKVTECTIEDVVQRKSAGETFVLVDVREESEFSAGRIPGAKHLGKGVIERDIEEAIPDPATPIVLYCGGGFRSVLAAEQLQKMGYTHVFSMIGGWKAWQTHTASI